MKQSAVEWLAKELESYGDPQYCELEWKTLDLLLEQAKEMHKAEIIDAYFEGAYGGDNISGEQYYQETFVSKGSGMSEKPNNHIEAQLPQQEISDGSKGRYREQLKQKQ